MSNTPDIINLIAMVQRAQESIDHAQRQERALTLQKFEDYHADTKSDYQRVLDGLYRLERKVEQGQKDMQIAQAAYQDEDQQERTKRQAQNDRRFRRIELWLALVTLAVLVVVARVLWVSFGGGV